MIRINQSFLILYICFFAGNSSAQLKSSGDFIQQTMLHPADAFTAYTFEKGEWAYNQAITPYPSWAWWGITDWLTAEIDIEAWLGGVPSLNFRFALKEQNNQWPALAYETMFQYIKNEFDQFHNLDFLEINRQGSSWYNRINASWNLQEMWHLHISGGFTYAKKIEINNTKYNDIHYTGNSFSNLFSPDFSCGIDRRAKDWISFHSTMSYGSTFLYADNIPRKQQFSLATRIAPLSKSKRGFFNSLRIELAFLYINFPDAKESFSGPIGFLYWQWNRKN